MGREKKRRERRDAARENQQMMVGVDQFQWTPIRQSCGCVVDWGWDGSSVPPQQFVEWCLKMLEANCLWHGAESGTEPAPPEDAVCMMNLPPTNGPILCRLSMDVELGTRISDELVPLKRALAEDGTTAGVMWLVPSSYVEFMRERGEDPAYAWTVGRLTELILNRGKSDMDTWLDAVLAGEEGRDREATKD